ncbi:MAG TPA: hypothetical protein VFH56_09270 [Acidimicrobiales bacterium]|nr:hypothetical protein [Acidimicrobiales bacterium]
MSEKRTRGRPPITGTARGEILRVRVSTDERALMQAAADKAGQPLALWAHDRLLAAAKRAR